MADRGQHLHKAAVWGVTVAVAKGSVARMKPELWGLPLKGFPKNLHLQAPFSHSQNLRGAREVSGQLVFRSQTGGLQAVNGLWI